MTLPLTNTKMTIQNAEKHHSRSIARLIMQAMSYDCCQWFAGKGHSLNDFEHLMTALVEADNSQYSYRNTLVALTEADEVAGVCVSYDGKQLHELRKAFADKAFKAFGKDFSGMADETQAGELYIDSLAVDERFRGRGIATMLLRRTIDKARQTGLPAVGLLVDKGNPRAERLYTRLGFAWKNDASWGGHPMKHLQITGL